MSEEREDLLSGKAWRDWCDRLKAAGERILEADFPSDERTRVEGFRALTRLLAYATRLEIEAGDPLHPEFVRYEEPHTQWGGPNPDNTYLRAVIDPRETYRIRANVRGVHQVIFCQHEGDMHFEQYGVYHERHLDDFEVEPDGTLEFQVGPTEQAGNWIPSHSEARLFTIRIYLSDWEAHASPAFHIERVSGAVDLPPPLAAGDLARGLDRAASWVEASIPYWNQYSWGAFRAGPVNRASPARSTPGGADNIVYGSCLWDLADDEALLLTCEVPRAKYWGFATHTLTWLESGDFGRRQTSLSGDQVHTDPDQRVRIAVSKQDPGVPNWIDTEGRSQGLLAYRWVWAESKPKPVAEVVKVSEIRSLVPESHPRVTRDERLERLRRRTAALRSRYL